MQSKTFKDYDAFAASVKDVDARMMFQNPKLHFWAIKQALLPNIHLQLGRLGSGNIVEGQSGSDGLLLYIPLTEDCEYRANGIVYKQGSVVLLEPGCEFCVASNSEHDWCTIQVPTEMFADSVGEQFAKDEKPGCRVSHANSRAAREIHRLVCQVMTNAAHHPEFENSLAARHVEAELSRVASEVVGRPSLDKAQIFHGGRRTIPRDEIIRRCKAVLEERQNESLRIEDLSNVSQVSERTLRRAFKEYFGVGPVRYLQLRQLHQVRRALQASAPEETTVTDVLFGHGVSELGRFATRYRKLFGELPSDTLRAKRR